MARTFFSACLQTCATSSFSSKTSSRCYNVLSWLCRNESVDSLGIKFLSSCCNHILLTFNLRLFVLLSTAAKRTFNVFLNWIAIALLTKDVLGSPEPTNSLFVNANAPPTGCGTFSNEETSLLLAWTMFDSDLLDSVHAHNIYQIEITAVNITHWSVDVTSLWKISGLNSIHAKNTLRTT